MDNPILVLLVILMSYPVIQLISNGLASIYSHTVGQQLMSNDHIARLQQHLHGFSQIWLAVIVLTLVVIVDLVQIILVQLTVQMATRKDVQISTIGTSLIR